MKTRVSDAGLWVALALVVLGAAAYVVAPVALLHPFRPQTPFGVALAFDLRGAAPVVTLGALALVLPLAALLASRLRRAWQYAALALLLALAGGSAWFARQNHFEWMFRPLPGVAHARAADATFVTDRDMVIGVEIAGDAVAYPVRQMAYHHLVNDVVGGTPVVSTY